MRKEARPRGFLFVLSFAPLFVATWFVLYAATAQENPNQKPLANEQQLIQKIKEDVMKELRDGEFLREQIQIGIEDYIKKQRDAQVAAKAEQARLATEKARNVRRVSTTRDHIYGNPEAPISLIEYSDFECPFCKNFHPTAKRLVQAYNGKVNWVYRHFPLNIHNPGAPKQAEASECANELGANDAFWKYTDAIYARTRSNGNGFPLANLVPLAKEIGLDSEGFRECAESGKYTGRVREDVTEGTQLGVTGTPGSILLHNETGEAVHISGAQPLDAFTVHIERMLKEK